jgi:hypothetical protein
MNSSMKGLFAIVAFSLPAAAFAQSSDATYRDPAVFLVEIGFVLGNKRLAI